MPTNRYAAGTDVPAARSRAEVEAILRRYGATQRGIMEDDGARRATVVFRLHERTIRLALSWPGPDAPEYQRDRNGWSRRAPERQRLSEAEHRRVWRVLILRLKSALESSYEDADAFRNAFLADTLLPDGRTVGEVLAGQLEETYRTGRMPAGLASPEAPPKQLRPGEIRP